MADPAEVTNVLNAFQGITTEANKKLCLKRIWDYFETTYPASMIVSLQDDILDDLRTNPVKFDTIF